MGKNQRQTRATVQRDGMARVEQHEVFDDNLLPDATQIEKLHSIDNGILPWLKSRAEKEQEFRHRAFNEKSGIIDKHNAKEHNTVRYGLTIYFVLVLGFGVASYFLIEKGLNVEGSVFGGTAVILALAVLVTKKPQSPVK